MITALDTNILLDIFLADAKFGRASALALRKVLSEGAALACDAVWAETAAAFPKEAEFLSAMSNLNVAFSPVSPEAALMAGAAWRNYRARGGKRDRVVADFLIGAHALTQCDRLLTRDRGFYRAYFSKLKVIAPL